MKTKFNNVSEEEYNRTIERAREILEAIYEVYLHYSSHISFKKFLEAMPIIFNSNFKENK